VRVAVVGAGPAGSLASALLSRDGATVVLFDPSHPREKPCGGGLTPSALAMLPAAPEDDPLPARSIRDCRLESEGESLEVSLEEPMAIASRAELDGWLLRRAVAAGVDHQAERVVEVEESGRLRLASGRAERFDLVIGADGATSRIRRCLLGRWPSARLMMAVGWFAAARAPMSIRFLPRLGGYMWLFPRRDHVAVGICGPLGAHPTRLLVRWLRQELVATAPRMLATAGPLYAHTIPVPSPDPRELLAIAGGRWALLGDAAGLADPITGEGLQYALRSAQLLAEAVREAGSLQSYPQRVIEDFGKELAKSAALRERFYSPGFTDRMIRYSARSRSIRRVLTELVEGRQGYLTLKRRLLRAAPRFLWESISAVAGTSDPRG
jgi:flavin-dependent dehydrogenase